jgi:hypothetical protein
MDAENGENDFIRSLDTDQALDTVLHLPQAVRPDQSNGTTSTPQLTSTTKRPLSQDAGSSGKAFKASKQDVF